ncbi:MAG: acyl-CoA dehydrogenase family protein, partial [Nitratireductor sp.]
MELAFSAADAAFRDEVRSFLDEKLTPDLRAVTRRMTSVYADYETTMTWHKALHEKGWVAPSWPVEHGGCDWSVIQHYIFSSELSGSGAPPLSPMGLGMCGPVLIGYGTPEQKAYYLPRILSGEDF